MELKESENSIWGEYGIKHNMKIPEHNGTYNVANHIRALLDMIEDLDFSNAQGMREDFICCEEYTQEIFEKVSMLFDSPNWKMIDRFMMNEYFEDWIRYKRETNMIDHSPDYISVFLSEEEISLFLQAMKAEMGSYSKELNDFIRIVRITAEGFKSDDNKYYVEKYHSIRYYENGALMLFNKNEILAACENLKVSGNYSEKMLTVCSKMRKQGYIVTAVT
ncbi:MAG: hypothetical protein ACI4RH_02035 [Huintestinicola sp.]